MIPWFPHLLGIVKNCRTRIIMTYVRWDSISSHLREVIFILRWNGKFSHYKYPPPPPRKEKMEQAAVELKHWRHVPGCRQAHLAAASEGLRSEWHGGNVFDMRWNAQMCFVHLSRCSSTSQLILRLSTPAAASKQKNLEKLRADACAGPQKMQTWWCNNVTSAATLLQ